MIRNEIEKLWCPYYDHPKAPVTMGVLFWILGILFSSGVICLEDMAPMTAVTLNGPDSYSHHGPRFCKKRLMIALMRFYNGPKEVDCTFYHAHFEEMDYA